MFLICKYWFDSYKALDSLGQNYIAIIESCDVHNVHPSHETTGCMKGKFVIPTIDSIESLTSIVNTIKLSGLNIDRVISIGELSQYGAGFLTDQLKCKGLSFDAINLTRDKRLMKTKFKELGVPCANFYSYQDNVNFDMLSYPLVAKPACGFGSFNTKLMHNSNQLHDYANNFKDFKDHHLISNAIIIEDFIDGDEYVADCFISSNKVVFLSISKDNLPRMQVTNEPGRFDSAEHLNIKLNHDLYKCIHYYYSKIVDGFNINECVCHMEFFINKSGEIIVSEVATRPGGSYFNHMAKHVYGKTLYEIWFEGVLSPNEEILHELEPDDFFTIVNMIPQKNGGLACLPTLNSLSDYRTLIDIIPRKKCGDAMHTGVALDYTCFFVFRSKDKAMLDGDVNKFVVNFDFIIF
ncbi:ATP-grasp domain-containing protein [Xenorhabdus budapestensis]|uniref:ATP-grasp domain-containing protein n=1 Tax=Xenorhabdus budapestensis TaxID=290110 RepID=A0ABX7VJ08_XENBU|nr:ATP-grasp domain-containing protein [Xenorhabdus budapestensis]QTL40390.1 ATP-grasp domain-containing protein [Xenorhabdus budapestensis]